MPFSAFIFDMDGTLIDNMGFHIKIWSEFVTSLGAPTDEDTFYQRTVGKVNAEILRDLVDPDLSDAEIEQLSARKEELYRQRFAPLMAQQAIPGLNEFLRAVSSAGLPMAVATSAGIENVHFILQGLGIQGFFNALVTAEEVTRGKPDPQIFLIAAAKLGISPEKCLVFEDSPSGLEAAARAGMRAVALSTTFSPERLNGTPGVLRIISNYRSLDPQALLDEL